MRPRGVPSRSGEPFALSNDYSYPRFRRTLLPKVARLLTNTANENSAETKPQPTRRNQRPDRGMPRSPRRPKWSRRTEADVALDDRLAIVQGHSYSCVQQGQHRQLPECGCQLRSMMKPHAVIGSVIVLARHGRDEPKISKALEARFIDLVDQRNPAAVMVWHWLKRTGKATLTIEPQDGHSLPGRFPKLRVAVPPSQASTGDSPALPLSQR